MKKFIKFPSIDQYTQAVREIRQSCEWNAEQSGEVVEYPVLTVRGTEKIHGTNASVCFNEHAGFWVQSRNNIITPENDNAGCAAVAYARKDVWMGIIRELAQNHNIDLLSNTISVFYEWCGGNVQTNSAFSGLEKRAVIFRHFKVSPISSDDEPSGWLPTSGVSDHNSDIWNAEDFGVYTIEVDFSHPGEANNKLIEMLAEIEENSPAGNVCGVKGNIAEGFVFTIYSEVTRSLKMFKVKGEKHSKSKVKKLSVVDTEKLSKIEKMAIEVTPSWRLEQFFVEVNNTMNGGKPDIKNIGAFIKAVQSDILKEETGNIVEAGLEPSVVLKSTAKIAQQYFKAELLG